MPFPRGPRVVPAEMGRWGMRPWVPVKGLFIGRPSEARVEGAMTARTFVREPPESRWSWGWVVSGPLD